MVLFVLLSQTSKSALELVEPTAILSVGIAFRVSRHPRKGDFAAERVVDQFSVGLLSGELGHRPPLPDHAGEVEGEPEGQSYDAEQQSCGASLLARQVASNLSLCSAESRVSVFWGLAGHDVF